MATTPSSSPGTQSNPTYAIWVQQDQLILSAIISSLSEELLPHVVGDFSSQQVWDILAQLYCATSRSRSCQIKYQLSTTRKGNDSIDAYYLKIKKHATDLAAIGEPLRESDHLAYLLAGLDASYDSFITSIHTLVTPPPLTVVYELLKGQENRNEKNLTPIDNPTANHVIRSNVVAPSRHQDIRGRSDHNGNNRYSNRNRYDNGYNKNSNRGGRAHGRNNSSNGYTPRCQLCREYGHYAPQCPSYQGPTPPSSAYTATHYPAADTWYHDSGATHHITSDMGNLNLTTEPYTGTDQLQVGDGTGRSHGGNSTPRKI